MRRTVAPMMAAWAVRLGHSGTTATTSSRAPASICMASISAFTPDEVTTTRSTSTGPCRPEQYAARRLAKFGQPEVVRVEGLAVEQRLRRGAAHRLGRDFVTLAEPEGQHVAATHGRRWRLRESSIQAVGRWCRAWRLVSGGWRPDPRLTQGKHSGLEKSRRVAIYYGMGAGCGLPGPVLILGVEHVPRSHDPQFIRLGPQFRAPVR